MALSQFDIQLEKWRKLIGISTNDLTLLTNKYRADGLASLRKFAKRIEVELRGLIQSLLSEGATVRTATKEIDSRLAALGVTEFKTYNIEAVYRTASSVAFNAGKWAALQEPWQQEILWGFQYSAIDDSRVRENHWAANGVTLPKDDPFWQRMWPPNGYNCRCDAIPLYAPETFVYPPDDAVADEGWGFNPGIVLQDYRQAA